jgi:hypothetical protein
MAPVVFSFRSIKFRINANDHNPPHVHVEGAGAKVRIDLNTLECIDDETEFSNSSLRRILEQVRIRREELLEEWSKYHEEKD